MNQSAYLHRLQQIDTQIDQAETRLAEIERLLSQDVRIQNATHAAEEARRNLELSRQALRAAEHHVKETQIKMEQSESALYSGSIRNPKELQDLQREIASLKRHMSQQEDTQIQTMLDVEAAEKTESDAQKSLLSETGEVMAQQAGLNGEREGLRKNVLRLQTERSAALTQILPQNLDTYQRIRSSKKGIAVTAVEEDTCRTCGAEVRPGESQASRMQATLHYCTSCGRILFAG